MLSRLEDGMRVHVTALERAFELAQSGVYEDVVSLKRRLSSEGYSVEQITGRTLVGQLKQIISKSCQGSP
jgi:hypothetical protein